MPRGVAGVPAGEPDLPAAGLPGADVCTAALPSPSVPGAAGQPLLPACRRDRGGRRVRLTLGVLGDSRRDRGWAGARPRRPAP